MEMTPVDFVAHAICHIAGETETVGKVFHLADPNPVPAERVFAWLEEIGYPLERLGYEDWLEALRESSREADDSIAGGILGGVPETHEFWDGNVYDDSNTREVLHGSGLRRPQINASLFRIYARRFVEEGLVAAPPESFEGDRMASVEGTRHR
jgi:hypothetical protein